MSTPPIAPILELHVAHHHDGVRAPAQVYVHRPRHRPRAIPAERARSRGMTKIHFILYVQDQARSTAFYAQVLACQPSLNVPGMTESTLAENTILGLMPLSGIKRLLGERLPDVHVKGDFSMPDVIGPDFITLQVRNLEVSRRFYADVIGFKPSPEVRPNAAAFATKPIGFAIRQAQIDLNAVAQLGYGVIVWFRTDDATALHAHLSAHGVPIVQGLAESPFGTTFTFRDPDGYLITVHDGG